MADPYLTNFMWRQNFGTGDAPKVNPGPIEIYATERKIELTMICLFVCLSVANHDIVRGVDQIKKVSYGKLWKLLEKIIKTLHSM